MGFLTDIRKKLNGTPVNGLDGRGAPGATSSVPRGRSANGAQQSRQPSRRPQGLDAGSDSQDSGVVIVHKDSQVTLPSVPDYSCPNCAAVAAASSARGVPVSARPSMEVMQPYSSSRQHLPGHIHDQPRVVDAGHDHSRPGTGYSNHSALLPMQSQPHRQQHQHHQHHDPGFSSRPLSWGRRATTENVAQDGPAGYTRPVTPPYSVTSEQTGWNSGQQYNNVSHVPGPASHDGFTSQRPTSWRRATSSNHNFNQDPRQQGHYAETAASSSRAPSEAGSNHPRNASKNMENTAYEAGYRDGM